MKKMKKFILLIMASVLFLMQPALTSVNNKYYQDYYNKNVEVQAGAITGSLTWAAIKAAAAAAGTALAPVAVGVVGAAAIGWVVDETIGWDVIADFGQGVIDNVTGRGGSVEDIYDAETETVRLTPEFVGATSQAVDTLPDSIIIDYGVWTALPNVTVGEEYEYQARYDVTIPSYQERSKLIIRGDFTGNAGYYSSGFTPSFHIVVGGQRYFGTDLEMNRLAGGRISSGAFEVVSYPIKYTGPIESIELKFTNTRGAFLTLKNVRATIVVDDVMPDDVIKEDVGAIKESVGATIEERNTYITNIIGGVDSIPLDDKQAVMGVNFAELASATQPEDIDEGTANDLGILGMLATIYNYVKSLPVRIVGAFTSLFNDIINGIKAIPGAISTGVDNLVLNMIALGNTLTGTLDDFLIDVNALGNTLAGSLDDLLIDVNALGNSLVGGLDEFLIDVNSIGNSLVGGLDEFLIDVNALGANIGAGIDSIISDISANTGILTGILDSIISAINAGVISIAELLTSILNGVIALPTTLVNILIADSSLVTDKVGQINLKMRNNPFSAFTDTLKNVFATRKSIFDIRITIKEKEYPLVPISLKPGLDTARNFLTGAIILIGSTIFYTRAKGISWWK